MADERAKDDLESELAQPSAAVWNAAGAWQLGVAHGVLGRAWLQDGRTRVARVRCVGRILRGLAGLAVR